MIEEIKISSPAEGTEEDEDSGSYFLQPASSPYDITQKVKQANDDLYNGDNNYEEKLSKVRFKDDLVDYEPEFSYDDASSIDSDANIDYSLMENDTSVLVDQLQTALILNISDVVEEEEEEEEEEQDDINEEIIEDIAIDESASIFEIEDDISFDVQYENNNKCVGETEINKTFENSKSNKKSRFNIYIPEGISCKRHCIDDVDRFDFNSNIKKMHLVEKPFKCPRLKLQRRNCCENNELKIQQKLPRYNGLRSEYGLNALQLERRQRRNEILKLKEQERQRIIEERKRKKEQQNEEVFCEWLKEVSSRKIHQKKSIKPLPTLNSATLMFSNDIDEPKRPKTANHSIIKYGTKKPRPHTSSSCVFIEVPQRVLRNGINIGDLLVTSGNQTGTKKLHVLTVS